jgi:hypothetical protein
MNDASAEVHFWREADVRREIDVAKCYEETSRPFRATDDRRIIIRELPVGCAVVPFCAGSVGAVGGRVFLTSTDIGFAGAVRKRSGCPRPT